MLGWECFLSLSGLVASSSTQSVPLKGQADEIVILLPL